MILLYILAALGAYRVIRRMFIIGRAIRAIHKHKPSRSYLFQPRGYGSLNGH